MKNTFRRVLGLVLAVTLMVTMAMPAEAAKKSSSKAKAATPTITASAVLLDRATIQLSANISKLPASDDGILYVYELACYEYAVPEDRAVIASVPLGKNPVVTFPYNQTRLYEKFCYAVRQGGAIVIVGEPQYISNPEVLADHTRAKRAHGLKGQQGTSFLNLWLNGNPSYGMATTLPRVVQLMNTGVNQTITNPYARRGMEAQDTHYKCSPYYMLNANDAAGVSTLTAEVSYYAAYGTADVYIVGNEVNVREWNYMIWTDWNTYMQQYYQVFRVIYNAIRSQNANAEVLVCVDCQWDRNRPENNPEYYEYMDVKDFLDSFNALCRAGGNIDWGIASHPHTCPLTYAKFWDMSGQADGGYYAAQIKGNKMVSFQNLSVMTNYMTNPVMLAPDGSVRYFMISEMGLSADQGPEVQAAAMAASYQAARQNPYIEDIIYLTAPQPGVNFGISGQSAAMFNALDGPETEAYLEWAKAYIGISDWSQVLR